jgi:putative redox protein
MLRVEKPDVAARGKVLAVAMSLTATCRSIPGTLRQDVLVDGRFHISTDEPASLGGEDTAPAPHELLVAALASCVSTTLAMYARTKGWDLGEIAVDADYDQASVPCRCKITIRIERDLSRAQLARLEKVAVSCPVRRSIEGGIVFDERIEPGGEAESEAA